MTKHRAVAKNPKTGQWEYKKYEEHRSNSQTDAGVEKMKAHFDAASSLEQQQLALIAQEQERLAAQKAQSEAAKAQRQQIAEERKAMQRQADSEFQEKQTKQEHDSLAQAMKENRVKHVGYKADL
ncbi:hypothetical protein [Vibrio crassostreae]|uniref:hypothetical protein n=1 Tax=Vibrio crassostreae TaxID=246167 RepID=UPI00104CF3B7|nr:hypothetical protein [Vibrio crassostreae]TCV07216.1 hypothetical protein EDB16_11773 [Vibrio crassostreae]TWD59039.1 hypothetical protein FB444_11736 [Vibrio crassostreae]